MSLDAGIGFGAIAGLAEEVTYGTSPGDSTHWLRLLDADVAVDLGIQPVPHLASANVEAWHNTVRSVQTKHEVDVDLHGCCYYDDKAFALLLKHAIGGVATTGSGPYTHTFTPDTDGVIGLSVHLRKLTGIALPSELITGCRVNTLDLEVSAQGWMTYRARLIGKSAGGPIALAGTPANTAVEEILAHHAGAFDYVPTLQNFRLAINNNLQRRPHIGSLYTDIPVPGGFASVMVEGERSLEDHDLYTAYLAASKDDMTYVFTGAGNMKLTLNMHNFQIESLSQPIDRAGELTQRFTARCSSNPTSEYGVSLELRNDHAAAI